MKLEYDYDQDPRYGWYTLKVESSDKGMVEVIIGDENWGTLETYVLNTATGVFKPTCMCNARNESECACGHYGS